MKLTNYLGIILVILTFILLMAGLKENASQITVKILSEGIKIILGAFVGLLIGENYA